MRRIWSLFYRAVLVAFVCLFDVRSMAVDFEKLNLDFVQNLSSSGHRMRIHQAIPDTGRYLAVIESREETDRKFAPAWFSKSWELIRAGEGIHASRAVLNPIPSDTHEQALPIVFPEILVRDRSDKRCPYIFGIVSEVTCLNENLEFGERYPTPVQVRGYKVIDHQVWFSGLYNGKLFHRIDLKTKKVDKSIIAVEDILRGFTEAGFNESALRDIQLGSSKSILGLSEGNSKMADATIPETQREHMRLLYRLDKLQNSFQFDIAVDRERNAAYLFLRRPVSLAVLQWPTGRIKNIVRIARGDLPEDVHIYQQLYINKVFTLEDSLAVWIYVVRGITLKELEPSIAQGMVEALNREDAGQNATPNAIVGTDVEHLLLRFRSDSLKSVTAILGTLRESQWKPISEPIFLDKEIWLNAAVTGKDGTRKSFGMVRLR